jgi:Ca2+-binding EF-hand superfamily protein
MVSTDGVRELSEKEDQEKAGEEDEIDQKKHSNPFIRLLCGLLKVTKKKEENKKKNVTLDILQPSRYKPNDLEQMARDTRFTKDEVRYLYRAFKQECPNGIVDEETFKDVYEKIFPLGDASHYAHLVFAAIDRDKTGGITFGDFMEFLSVISKGTERDKLMWTFTFYDVDHDGVISKEEMLKVMDAIHELMGGTGSVGGNEARQHVNKVFETMDLNQDGTISVDEFMTYCTSHQDVTQSLTTLNY